MGRSRAAGEFRPKEYQKNKRNPQVPLGVSGLSASAVVTAVEAVEQALHEIAVLVVEALAVAQQDRRGGGRPFCRVVEVSV